MAEQKDEYKELEVLRKIVRSCYPMEIYDGNIMMNDTFFTLEKDSARKQEGELLDGWYIRIGQVRAK